MDATLVLGRQGRLVIPADILTARENLLVVADFSRRDKKKSAARADQLLAELGLKSARPICPANSPAGSVSGWRWAGRS